jgi:hypothetical protein
MKSEENDWSNPSDKNIDSKNNELRFKADYVSEEICEGIWIKFKKETRQFFSTISKILSIPSIPNV